MNNKQNPPKPRLVNHSLSDSSMAKPEFVDTGILHVKKSSKIVGTNPRAMSLLEYPEDFRLEDRELMEICESIDSGVWATLLGLIDKDTAVQFRAVFRTHRGGFKDVSCLAVCETGATVVDLYISDSVVDNSEYIDSALSRLEYYEAFFNTELFDINLKDKEGRYIATSRLFEETFGLSKGQAIGKKPHDLFPKDFADHVASHDNTVLDRKDTVSQMDVVPYSGKQLMVQKFPLYKNQSIAGVGVFAVDVTALKMSEQRQIASKNKYSDYSELCTDILWETNQDWIITESNILDTWSVSGISFRPGINVVSQLKDNLMEPSLIDEFINSLVPNKITRQIWQLKNGTRVKIGVKPINIDPADHNTPLIYRGIVTVLNGV